MDRHPRNSWPTTTPPPPRARFGRPQRLAVLGTVIATLALGITGAQAAPTVPALPAGTQTLWGSAQPLTAAVDPDTNSVELGQQFTPTVSGSVLGVKFWKTGQNSGTHVGNLWSKDGRRLASVTFTGETSQGWQVATFSSPVTVTAGTQYVVSYLAPDGRYSTTERFAGVPSAPQMTIPRANSGVYAYGSRSSFPCSTWHGSVYWVDAVFRPASPSSTPSTSPSPTPSASPTQSSRPSPTPSASQPTTPSPSPTATQPGTPSPTPSATAKPTRPPRPTTPPSTAPAPPPATTPPSAAGFPNATTTGVPAGVALTPYTGPSRITTPGTVIDSQLITTPLVITAGADNVTIKNSVVRAQGFFLVLNDEGARNLQIVDTELDGQGNTSGDAAVGGYNYTLTRVNIHGTMDGLKIGDKVTVQDSYIHDLVMTSGSHNDGIQSLGSDDVLIRHNSIVIGKGSTSAIILSTGSADSMKRIVIDGNLLGGGAYTVYGGYLKGTDDLSKVSGVVISNNHFTTSVYPNGGAYGPLTSVDPPAVTVTGNVWQDGPKAGQSL